ncbi:hypothetical protein ACHWUR_29360 [Klebsiella pneumoniae]
MSPMLWLPPLPPMHWACRWMRIVAGLQALQPGQGPRGSATDRQPGCVIDDSCLPASMLAAIDILSAFRAHRPGPRRQGELGS